MAHKNLVGGTAYDTKGGRCLVDGTGYDVKKGRTLVGGTGYDIIFSGGPIPVTITGTGSSSVCYVIINGTTITSATTAEVMPGDVITFGVKAGTFGNGIVTIDGVTVLNSSERSVVTYAWTVPEYVTEITIVLKISSGPISWANGEITVTAGVSTVPISITGSGNTSYCYVTIHGNKITSGTNVTVIHGEVVVFGVQGKSTAKGTVTIDGETVLSVSIGVDTYEWTVPDGLKSISIGLAVSSAVGTITVTTS